MKKVLIVLSISAFFVACNGNSTKSSDATKDSATAVTADTSKMAPAADTSKMAPAAADTTKAKADSTKK